jgi:hypothetical protein
LGAKNKCMKNDFVIYYSNQWLDQAIKDNNCKTEKELYEKTFKVIA